MKKLLSNRTGAINFVRNFRELQNHQFTNRYELQSAIIMQESFIMKLIARIFRKK